tara:strand:- start:17267 stop:18019 length:753 start_codon:yes stop_codon:yes gene_type:complete
MSLSATYFGSNGWLIEFGQFRILVDPWLTGKLTFPPGSWLIEGRLKYELETPKGLDLVLLTQGLADHSHIPSLNKLDKSIPVIGSTSAAQVARSLKFETVFTLKPGETKLFDELTIQASEGASVPNIENGYLLVHDAGSVYLEPHGFLDKAIPKRLIDAVITPVVNLRLPIAGNFIKGKSILPELIDRFKPLTVLSSTTGGEAMFTGLLNKFIRVEGSYEEARSIIDNGIKFIEPEVGKPYKLKTYKVKS